MRTGSSRGGSPSSVRTFEVKSSGELLKGVKAARGGGRFLGTSPLAGDDVVRYCWWHKAQLQG